MRHALTTFVTDRLVLDYLVWTGINAVSFYAGVLSKPELLIIAPTPSLQWYRDHHDEFLTKQSRVEAYAERLGIKVPDDLHSDKFIEGVHDISRNLEHRIADWCTELQWPYFWNSMIDRRNDSTDFRKLRQSHVMEHLVKNKVKSKA